MPLLGTLLRFSTLFSICSSAALKDVCDTLVCRDVGKTVDQRKGPMPLLSHIKEGWSCANRVRKRCRLQPLAAQSTKIGVGYAL